MSGRAGTILANFPRHLAADDPGKRFGAVTAALAAELDVKTSQLGRVRRSHGLGTADEQRDLRLLAGLHGLGERDFELARVRLDAVRAPDAADRLQALLGVPADALPGDELTAALRELTSHRNELELLRGTIAAIVGCHRAGNATPSGLLAAAAAYLQLDVRSIAHADDRFWHAARCSERLRLADVVPADDLVAVEENPLQGKEIEPVARGHGDIFHVFRGGFDDVTVTIRVRGVADRTVAPMVVNVDSGHGVAFTGSVAAGDELRFESDGRVTLGGDGVAGLCYGFRGGVFADADAVNAHDFVFDAATFTVTEPVADALDPGAAFPHAEGLVGGVTMALGESRWAYFVRAAHYGRDDPDLGASPAIALFSAGIFDSSVFSPAGDAAGEVGFAWQEREPFALTVWIPQRFAELDGEGDLPVRERLRLQLDRHRAAGVHVYCRYADDRWSLGEGLLRDLDAGDPRGVVVAGTRLWQQP